MGAAMSKRMLITSDRMGRGDDELGRLLMRNFLYSVARNPVPPASIMLLNEGVRLACAGSDSLDDLRLCVSGGVSVSSCGTCLDYLGLTDKLKVGEVGTMPGTVTALLGDDAVVTIS